MNALDQYIDLYRQHSVDIAAHAPALFNDARAAALRVVESTPLPEKGDETYSALSPNELLSPDYGVNINRVNFPVDTTATFHCGVPNVSTLMAFVVNDTFVPSATLARNLPEGVRFMSLAAAAAEMPATVAACLGTLADNTDPAVALNTLLLQDGVYVHIPAGYKLEKPLQLVNIFNSATPLMGVRRIVVSLGADASASMLICDHSQMQDVDYLANQVVEIHLAAGASLDLYDLEESSERTSRLSHLFARQGAGSSLTINGTTLLGGRTRNDYHIDIAGDHAETKLAGLAIGSDTQVIDNLTDIHHHSTDSQSSQMFKYVLNDRAVGAFYGRIVVDEKAERTNAYQSNRNILANEEARMYTRPQLEIYCDEVKCSHGATVGQLDANALFYLRSRGIPLAEARLMLMQAFMADVIDTVRIPALQSRLHQLVETRLNGRRVLCADCPL